VRQPVRCVRTGLWLARYMDEDGRLRQAGRFERKRDAQAAIIEATTAVSAAVAGADEQRPVTVRAFFEAWPARFPRHPRTIETNVQRIAVYVLPYLPRQGDFPLEELKRAMLREVMAHLLALGLAKSSIDGVFSSLSAMLTDAVDDEVIDANPARAFRVKPNDPRLRPKRPARDRRAVPPAEVGAFMACVPARWRAVCWAPFLTGARPGELFAMKREEIDADANLIYLHETADRYGRIEPGTKTTHHIPEKERRGRWTLFPPALLTLLTEPAQSMGPVLFPTPRGRVWHHRNFYADVWRAAREASGTDFTLYDARHTFSSRLLAAGVPLVEVAAWMGHSLRAGGAEVNTTTRMYAHATGEHRTAALAELERFFERTVASKPAAIAAG
jgi:integrase